MNSESGYEPLAMIEFAYSPFSVTELCIICVSKHL